MTKTNNIICEKCGASEEDDLVVRIEDHYKNPDHTDKTVPTGYLCMNCGFSNCNNMNHKNI